MLYKVFVFASYYYQLLVYKKLEHALISLLLLKKEAIPEDLF